MPNTPLNTTDTELLEQLETSFIEPEQKAELKNLLPQMNEEERAELRNLIRQSTEEVLANNPEYQARLAQLNQEYTEKMQQLSHEQMERARKDIEQAEKLEESEALSGIEGEISDMEPGKSEKAATPQEGTSQHPTRKSGFKLLLIALAIILVLAAGALYALTQM